VADSVEDAVCEAPGRSIGIIGTGQELRQGVRDDGFPEAAVEQVQVVAAVTEDVDIVGLRAPTLGQEQRGMALAGGRR
jgi:hypothetical protein